MEQRAEKFEGGSRSGEGRKNKKLNLALLVICYSLLDDDSP
jgi:hypothetical protein